MIKKTKIVCTLGPASTNYDTINQMLINGMNVARLNFSHGSHESHRETIELFRQVRDELRLPAAVMLDTKGPEIRIGDFAEGSVEIYEGDTFTLTSQQCLGDNTRVSVTYADLPSQMEPGDTVLIDDGMINMEVQSTTDTDIFCIVRNSGTLKNRKGVNLPGKALDFEYLSEHDKDDLLFGIEMDVDYVAASFVRNMDDVKTLRNFLNQNGGHNIKIISKIENIQGIEDFDNILEASDGIMVARGDMGVELDFELLPGLQKKLIGKCVQAGKPVITATQMLESMTENSTPTRAEITDVANAIFDGTSAVMLSGESAAGKHPVESVRTMSKIIAQAEKDYKEIAADKKMIFNTDFSDFSNAIAHAACTTAIDIDAKAIIAITTSGYTAEKISKYRPEAPIIAATPNPKTYHQQALIRGVYPIHIDTEDDLDTLMNEASARSIRYGLIEQGDPIVFSAGLPLKTAGTTNMIRVKKA